MKKETPPPTLPRDSATRILELVLEADTFVKRAQWKIQELNDVLLRMRVNAEYNTKPKKKKGARP